MSDSSAATGLLIAHGSPDPRHAAALRRLAEQVAAKSPSVRCELAFLDHNQPLLAEWLARRSAQSGSVRAIGLLLASGYHAQVDIPRTIDATSTHLSITNLGTIGSGSWLMPVLARSISEAGGSDASPVVLVSAGSSQEQARADLRAVCSQLQDRRHRPVLPAAVTGPDPGPQQVVAGLDVDPSDVVVVPLMLAPGKLADRATEAAESAGARAAGTITSENHTPPELVAELITRLAG